MPHIHEGHDPLHPLGVIALETIVESKGIHIDDGSLQAGIGQQGHPILHQLPLGRNQQDLHLWDLRRGIQDFEVEFDAVDVEGHVLLGLPADHLTGVGFLHPIHLDLLDDHVVATHRRDDLLALQACFCHEVPDRLGDHAGIHHLALHDRVRKEGAHQSQQDFGAIPGVVDLDELDVAAPDVEPHRTPATTEKAHGQNPGRGDVNIFFPSAEQLTIAAESLSSKRDHRTPSPARHTMDNLI